MAGPLRLVRARADLLTASRIDLALILLPLIGRPAAAGMMARSQVPVRLSLRVLATPGQRRPPCAPACAIVAP
jgi:hypothetical protein